MTSAAGEIETRGLVISAGLFADEVVALLGSKMAEHKIYPVGGDYCEIVRGERDLICGLVYPMPHADALSLGAHFTRTLWGNVRIGPTARYIEDKSNYERNRETLEEFARHAKLLLPEIGAADLRPAHSGIRAELVPPPSAEAAKSRPKGMADVIIERDPEFPNVVQLIGIESPGLTSAPAIAENVGELVNEFLE